MTVIKGAGFYRRSRQMDHVSDYLFPSDLELQNMLEQSRYLVMELFLHVSKMRLIIQFVIFNLNFFLDGLQMQ